MLVRAQLRRDDIAWDAISAPKNEDQDFRLKPRSCAKEAGERRPQQQESIDHRA
jgi:hypothetical protein